MPEIYKGIMPEIYKGKKKIFFEEPKERRRKEKKTEEEIKAEELEARIERARFEAERKAYEEKELKPSKEKPISPAEELKETAEEKAEQLTGEFLEETGRPKVKERFVGVTEKYSYFQVLKAAIEGIGSSIPVIGRYLRGLQIENRLTDYEKQANQILDNFQSNLIDPEDVEELFNKIEENLNREDSLIKLNSWLDINSLIDGEMTREELQIRALRRELQIKRMKIAGIIREQERTAAIAEREKAGFRQEMLRRGFKPEQIAT